VTTPRANTNQQIGIGDISITDDDQIQAVRDWWELERQFNASKAQMSYSAQEKAVRVAKEKALKMIELPEDGSKHRMKVEWDGGGTVISTTPPGDPKEVSFVREPKTQFRLEGTKAEEL
jgi:hypothetical protein